MQYLSIFLSFCFLTLTVSCGRAGFGAYLGGNIPSTTIGLHFGTPAEEEALDIVLSADHSFTICGSYDGPLNFGGGVRNTSTVDMFLAHFDSNGVYQWDWTPGLEQFAVARDLARDERGNIYVAGIARGVATRGGVSFSAGAHQEAFFGRFAPDGSVRSLHSWGEGQNAQAWSVTVPPDGNSAALSGFFGAELDFGSGAVLSTPLASDDGFYVRFGSRVSEPVADSLSGDDGSVVNSISMDNEGNLCMAITAIGSMQISGVNINLPAREQAVVASVSSQGIYRWSRTLGSSGRSAAVRALTTPNGDCVVTGRIGGEPNWDSGTSPPYGDLDIFVARFEGTTGSTVFTQIIGTTAVSWASNSTGPSPMDLAVDNGGNTYLIDRFPDKIVFGDSTLLAVESAVGLFVARFDARGKLRWLRKVGEAQLPGFGRVGIDVEPNGAYLIIAGTIRADARVGDLLIPNAGNEDIFVYRYFPPRE